MAMWFIPNHRTEFSDIGTIFLTVYDWVLKVGIRADFGSRTVGKCVLDFVVNGFRDNFLAEFEDCFMAEFIAVNDSLEGC